jgi:hypothetical protein
VTGVVVDEDGSGGVVYMAIQRTFSAPGVPRPPGAVYAERVDALGNNLWSHYDPNLGYTPPPTFTHDDSLAGLTPHWLGVRGFDVLSDGAGGAFFTWGEIGPNGLPSVYVQHLGADGVAQAGWPTVGRLVRNDAGDFEGLKLAPNGAGGVFVAWVDHRNAQSDLFVHGVLADGSLLPGIPADGLVLASPQINKDLLGLESDGQGGVFVVRGSSETNGMNPEVRLYRLDAALLPREGWPNDGLLLSTAIWWGGSPLALAADGQGGAFVAFHSAGGVYPVGLIGQHLAGDGSPAPGWTSNGYLLSATGFTPRIVRSGNGAIVAWDDSRLDAPGVYAQRLVPDGPVAVQLSLVGATAEPGNVSLHWYATGAAMLAAAVERRTDDTDWQAVGVVNADGSGHLRYEDGSVTGGRFGYRVSWSEDGSIRNAGEVWVDVPDAWRLALSAPRPNPGSGPASFAVTLAERAPASIELLDLQGRRVAHRDLGMFDPGSHIVAFEEAAALAPGVYLARLTQGPETRTVRLIRIR